MCVCVCVCYIGNVYNVTEPSMIMYLLRIVLLNCITKPLYRCIAFDRFNCAVSSGVPCSLERPVKDREWLSCSTEVPPYQWQVLSELAGRCKSPCTVWVVGRKCLAAELCNVLSSLVAPECIRQSLRDC